MSNMNLLQSAKELSAQSLDQWGDRIGSRKLSRQIAALDRFSDRVINRVFSAAGQDNAEDETTARHQGFGDMHNQPAVAMSEQDVQVGNAIRNDAASFVRICGIVVYGDVYRKNVARKEFGDLQRSFSQGELRIGCQLRDEHRRFSDAQVDMKRLVEMTNIAGNHCLAVWFASMPAKFRREMEMIGIHAGNFPAYSEIGLAPDHCLRIVRAVGHQLKIQ